LCKFCQYDLGEAKDEAVATFLELGEIQKGSIEEGFI
jgi:hypothetical protein